VSLGAVSLAVALAAAPVGPQAPTRENAARAAAPASKVKASDPSVEKTLEKARAARAAGRREEAASHFRQALQLQPGSVAARWELGSLLYELDQYEEARVEFRRVTEAEPGGGPAWALKGLCEFRLRNYGQALADIQKGRQLGLGGAGELVTVANYHLAIILNRAAEHEQAFEVLRPFARNGADQIPILEAIGLAVLRIPLLPDEAPTDRREMILMAGRAGYLLARGRTPVARAAFEELATRYPDAPNVHYAFGVFLIADETNAALEEFRRELQIQPNHVHALLQVAFELISRRAEYEEARPYAEKAAAIAPTFFAAHHAIGRIQLETGQIDQALAALETAARLAPDSPDVQYTLARAYQRAGRTEDAAKAREAFARLDHALKASGEGRYGLAGRPPEVGEKPTTQEGKP
jgi:tetratricopeptide (TPR) repeat protein